MSYELPNGRELLNGLDFLIPRGLTALVGPNGVGKTTLARLLAGELMPTAGSIRRDGPIGLFRQRQEPEALTVAEYLSTRYEWSLAAETLLEPIDRQARCTELSGGQWMRVRLAGALGRDFLILDEPTNDLDREGRRAVIEFLRGHPRGALLISHDRECLQLCDEILELSNRGIARYGGGWSAYLHTRDRERQRFGEALERAKRERDQARVERVDERARQEKRNRQGARRAARGGMPKLLSGARKRRAQVSSGKTEVATMCKLDSAVLAAHRALSEIKVDPVMYPDLGGQELPAQALVAEAQGFNVRFRNWIFAADLNFVWRGNLRLAVRGANGAGKSLLLKAVLDGGGFESRGQLRRGDLAALYLDQRFSLLDEGKSILDNVRAASVQSESEIRTALAQFLFEGDAVFQKVRDLSGGERLRAALARAALSIRKPNLLLLDEPTNNLDHANVALLETVVSGFRGALVVVSHDERFLEHCGVTCELSL